MDDLVITPSVLEKAKQHIEDALIKAGVHTVLLIDDAGNVVANCGRSGSSFDTTALAALAAANFGATSQIARLIGEEDFTLLFHRGKKDSIHFAKVGNRLILITIFGEEISLGLVRLRVAQLTKIIEKIFNLDN